MVLRVDGVTKGFGCGTGPLRRRVEVLKGASLEVRASELVGLVGENGSGKAGTLAFFQVSSSRGADRRLATAGLGPVKVAVLRIVAAGAIGALAGAVLDKLAATYLILFLVTTDLGVVQSPMFHTEPGPLAVLLPGYRPSRVMYDGAFSPGFDAGGELLLNLVWLGVLGVAVYVVLRRAVRGSA